MFAPPTTPAQASIAPLASTEREALHSAILDAALDCIIIMDADGVIREWNPAAERTFLIPRDKAVGTLLSDTIIPPRYREAHAKGLARYLTTGEARVLGRRIEITAVRPDQSEFPVELTITETRAGERPLFTAYLRDITARVQMETELRALNEALELRIQERTAALLRMNDELEKARAELENSLRAEQEIGELRANFVTTVSHEFRTPLGVILTSAEILEAHYSRLDDEERREHLRTIHDAVRRMSDLMEEVLVFHKLGAGGDELETAPIDLAALCRRLSDEVLSSTAHRCPVLCEADNLPTGHGNEKLIRHILINLLTNAVKYSPSGSPVSMSVTVNGDFAEFRISDHGIGIPPEDIPKLFQPFRRGSNVGQRAGTGLGLTIVKKCVDLHNGEITVESKTNCGTIVAVQLPVFRDTQP